MLSAIIQLITFYKNISIHFMFIYRVQTYGFVNAQTIKKPQRQFKETE